MKDTRTDIIAHLLEEVQWLRGLVEKLSRGNTTAAGPPASEDLTPVAQGFPQDVQAAIDLRAEGDMEMRRELERYASGQLALPEPPDAADVAKQILKGAELPGI